MASRQSQFELGYVRKSGWYICRSLRSGTPVIGGAHLHRDGKYRSSTYNHETGRSTGYWRSPAAALKLLRKLEGNVEVRIGLCYFTTK